jgi:hypothetical protein
VEQRRSQWNFQSTEAGWIWNVVHSDQSTETSQAPFKTLKQCVDDAAQHGYVVWNPEAERRRDLLLGVSKILSRQVGSSAA